MTDFTLTPPILAAILCNALPLVFQPLPPPPLLVIIAQSLNSNVSSREDHIPHILTVLLDIHRVYI